MDHSGADGRDRMPQWAFCQLALCLQFLDGQGKRDEGSGDRRRAGAAVGLQNVTVHPDRARSELFQIEGSPQ